MANVSFYNSCVFSDTLSQSTYMCAKCFEVVGGSFYGLEGFRKPVERSYPVACGSGGDRPVVPLQCQFDREEIVWSQLSCWFL